MEIRHNDTLMDRLEEAMVKGCSYIVWKELNLWYDKEKIAAKPMRDIDRRWQGISAGKMGRLLMLEDESGFFIFPEKGIKPVDPDGSGFVLD